MPKFAAAPFYDSRELTPGMSADFEIDAQEFDRRRALARRLGSPAWLWPEVTVSAWAEAVSELSKAVAAILAGRRASLPCCDRMALSLACYTTGIGPLLGFWLQAGTLRADAEVAALLELHLEHSRERCERVSTKARKIVRELTRNTYPVVVLKGGHTAYSYFPDPATRPSSDLDLLVPSDQVQLAEAVLAKAGFQSVSRTVRESSWVLGGERREPRSLWMVHADDPWSVDLHSSLDFSASPGAPLVRLDGANLFESVGVWQLEPSACVLQQPNLLLHLAVHASGGLHSLTLLRMVEIVLMIRQDSATGRLSWDEFLELAQRTGGLGAAYPALRLSDKLAPGTVPHEVLACSAAAAPARVKNVIEKLEPATAQRVHRASIGEHFMWVAGVGGWLRQLGCDLVPERELWPVYQARTYRLLRGRFSL